MSEQTIDAEVVQPQSQALAVRPPQQAVGLFGSVEPVQVIEKATAVASALKDVLKKQGLISNISGKEYPKCEAWTLLGTMLGVFPVLEWCRQVDGGWEARVLARTKDGATVGAAEAECLRSEKNWQNREDFALRSMAQTRATAKCLRMPLGFVMTLAGYEATPAEEMTFDHPKTPPKPSRPPSTPTPPQKTPPRASNAQSGASTPPDEAEKARRSENLRILEKLAGKPFFPELIRYFQECPAPSGKILLAPFETLEDLPASVTAPLVRKWDDCLPKIEMWLREHPKQGDPQPIPTLPTESPTEPEEEPWRAFPMPFGKNAGTLLGELDKKYLFGLWANYTVETEYNGKPKKPETIAKDREFRAMLDMAGIHYKFTKKD